MTTTPSILITPSTTTFTLDPDQQAAVNAPLDTPVLVLAGAGSGKTAVLTARIAWLINEGMDPRRILATTFTRAAAQEIKDRVSKVVGPNGQDIEAGTIHSFCLRLLKAYVRPVTVLENGQQRRLIQDAVKDAYEAMGIPERDKRRLGWKYWAGWIEFLRFNSKAALVAQMEASRPGFMYTSTFSQIAIRAADNYLRAKGSMYDFSDMLLKADKLLENPEIREATQLRYSAVLVDEFQDTDRTQLHILSTVADGKRLFAVGDPDQSMYKFRMARPEENIFGFKSTFQDATVIKLGTNYRSTQRIVQHGKDLIHQNYLLPDRAEYEKALTARPDAPEGLEVFTAYHHDSKAETKWLVGEIQKLLADGSKPQDIYVVGRINALLALPERALSQASIPAVSAVGCYWDNPRVVDVVSYMALAHNTADDNAFLAVYDIPSPAWDLTTRRLGRRFIEELESGHSAPNLWARGLSGAGLWGKMEASIPAQKPFRQRAIRDLVEYVEEIREDMADLPLADVVERLVKEYQQYWIRREGEDAVEDLEVLEVLPEIMSSYPTFMQFANMVTGVRAAAKKANGAEAVVLSTVHRVKGLERPTVFAIGMSEGLLPHWLATGDAIETANGPLSRAIMPPSPFDGAVEDERCAAYVLVTRAKERLYLSGSRRAGKKLEMAASRFIQEMGLAAPELPPELEADNG